QGAVGGRLDPVELVLDGVKPAPAGGVVRSGGRASAQVDLLRAKALHGEYRHGFFVAVVVCDLGGGYLAAGVYDEVSGVLKAGRQGQLDDSRARPGEGVY